jgi:hypothetical protein
MGYWIYLIQTLALMTTKLAILTFYRRIFTVRFPVFRWSIYGTMVFATLSGIASFIVFVFQCVPVQLFWLRCWLTIPGPPPVSLEGHCLSATIHVVVPLFFDLASEIAILILPVIGLWNLQLAFKKKVGLFFAFSLGIFVTAISIIRLAYAFPVNIGLDMPWDDVNIFLWTVIQVSFGIVGSCVPAMAPLFWIFKKRTGGTAYGTHRSGTKFSHGGTQQDASRKLADKAGFPETVMDETESTRGLDRSVASSDAVNVEQDWAYDTTFSNTITTGPKKGYAKQREDVPLMDINVKKEVLVEQRPRAESREARAESNVNM